MDDGGGGDDDFDGNTIIFCSGTDRHWSLNVIQCSDKTVLKDTLAWVCLSMQIKGIGNDDHCQQCHWLP